MKKPRISILLAIYNEEKYIVEALNSLLEQSVSDFEVLIVDDGSTDKTVALIQPFLKDERFVLLEPGKVGKNKAFNIAFSHSKADWLTFFCGDDILPDESIEHKLHYAVRQPKGKPAIGYSRVRMISEDKTYDGIELPKQKNKGSDSGSAMIFSREMADIIFPLPDNVPNEDQWTALCGKYFAKVTFHIPHVCWHYRIHAHNSHNRNADFETYNRLYHDRFVVFGLFRDRFKDKLDSKAINELNALDELERNRWNKSWSGILRGDVTFFEKLRAIIYSSSLLYSLRKRFYRMLSGW